MKLLRVRVFTFLLLLATSKAAYACPVCFQSGGEERWAFYVTTAFLTLLPISMVGGLVLWLRKRFRQLEEESAG
ncbi:MAG: hypothetical protein CMI18_09480 [Opitutaceae bacterium]|nr:hypothetical protein [Opitutaceae bacterium]|tara:strand:- start:2661 stop:2882 length:222 start_codon:yes stop_codon:yes gene_type:complete